MGLGLLIGGLVGAAVELEQHLTRLDELIVPHGDVHHSAGDGAADRDPRALDLGVVGGFVAAAGEEEEQRHRQDEQNRPAHDGQAIALQGAAGRRRRQALVVGDRRTGAGVG